MGMDAQIDLKAGDDSFAVGAGPQGFFIKENDESLFECDSKTNECTLHSDVMSVEALRVDSLRIHNTPQWRMGSLDMFDEDASGWSGGEVYKCPGFALLSGKKNPKGDSLTKQYVKLPEHNQIRVEANFHMLDDFQGECCYLKIGKHIVATAERDQRNVRGVINICGDENVGDSQSSVILSAAVPHTEDNLTVSFGCTVEKNTNVIFGPSSVAVYYRTRDLPGGRPNTATNKIGDLEKDIATEEAVLKKQEAAAAASGNDKKDNGQKASM